MSKATGELITRIYSNFRGVDFRGEEINLTRSPDSLNVWKDYKETESIRTRPGLAIYRHCGYPVYGIYQYKDSLMIHTGATLRRRTGETETLLCAIMAMNPSQGFVYEDIFYIKDGKNYLQYDGTTIKEVEGYVPTTSIGRKPSGGGTIYEDANMLTGRRINTFLADGGSFDFVLDAQNIDTDFPPIVKVNDAVVTSGYTVDYKKGKITFFGCPAEEGGGGKVYMARDGVFDKIDSVVSWHPESMYMVRTRPALANVSVVYSFDGISSHAGAAPDKGRSALDAVELMNVGVNFLREHMETTSRIHYAITDAGGHSPNVVQSHAVVKYMIRAVNSASVRALKERVDKIAEGAALMTETTVTNKVVGSYADLITIPALQKTADEAMRDIPLPVPSKEEIEFFKAIRETMNLKEEKPLFATEVLEPMPPVAHGGSTDTADVSWCAPTVQMHIGTWVIGTAGHSWQAASQSGASYAKKASLYAGKAVAGTIMRLFENPEIIKNAKEEHKNKTQGGYICGIGKDLVPDIY